MFDIGQKLRVTRKTNYCAQPGDVVIVLRDATTSWPGRQEYEVENPDARRRGDCGPFYVQADQVEPYVEPPRVTRDLTDLPLGTRFVITDNVPTFWAKPGMTGTVIERDMLNSRYEWARIDERNSVGANLCLVEKSDIQVTEPVVGGFYGVPENTGFLVVDDNSIVRVMKTQDNGNCRVEIIATDGQPAKDRVPDASEPDHGFVLRVSDLKAPSAVSLPDGVETLADLAAFADGTFVAREPEAPVFMVGDRVRITGNGDNNNQGGIRHYWNIGDEVDVVEVCTHYMDRQIDNVRVTSPALYFWQHIDVRNVELVSRNVEAAAETVAEPAAPAERMIPVSKVIAALKTALETYHSADAEWAVEEVGAELGLTVDTDRTRTINITETR